MNIIETYGRYGVVDTGKKGGIHTTILIKADGKHQHVGTHMNLAMAQLVAQGLASLDRPPVVEAAPAEPTTLPGDLPVDFPVDNGPSTRSFKLGGFQFSFSKV